MKNRIAEIIAEIKNETPSSTEPAGITSYEEISGEWLDDEENQILYAVDGGLLYRKITTPSAGRTSRQFWYIASPEIAAELRNLVRGIRSRVKKVRSL